MMNSMLSIDFSAITTVQKQQYLQGAIGPRPIAFASTIDGEGKPNLSPFSFFNVFSANPPLLIFSPARRVRDNTIKHTLENIKEVAEVVINVVNFDMVQQASLSSVEYPKGINEFEKSGFTAIASDIVKPFRVKESPVQMECKVIQIIETGTEGGAGNLVLCEVLKMHISNSVLNEKGSIDQEKIDLVARMGGNWYCRAFGDALFEVEKPVSSIGIGVDQIPSEFRNSVILSGNDLGMLGNVETLPMNAEIDHFIHSESYQTLLNHYQGKENQQHLLVKHLLNEKKVHEAWMVLLA